MFRVIGAYYTIFVRIVRNQVIRFLKKYKKSWRRPTLARPGDALPSAMEPLTSVFGMGTGMTAPPWSPAKERQIGSEREMRLKIRDARRLEVKKK